MNSNRPKQAFCTIIARNYLAFARTLCQSLAARHPTVPRFVLIVDDCRDLIDPPSESFEIVDISQLGIPALTDFTFKYNVTELCTAVKPYLLDVLLHRYGFDQLIYLDPDIVIFQGLDSLFDRLAENPIVLTPHVTSPLPNDGFEISEPVLLNAGIFNLGFIGVARSDEAIQLLRWWQDRLYEHCLIDFARGLFVDQKWIDFLPAFPWRAGIVRDPGYNVAYWNLHERRLSYDNGHWLVNGLPLYFYHFSGIQLDDLTAISKHQTRFTLTGRPELKPLFKDYRERVMVNGHDACRGWGYGYGRYLDGRPVTDRERRYYRALGGRRLAAFPEPFRDTGAKGIPFHAGVRAAIGNARQLARAFISAIKHPGTPFDQHCN